MFPLHKVRDVFSRADGTRQHARSFTDEQRRAGAVHQRMARTETVQTQQIVGSVSRAHELRRDFRPPRNQRRRNDNERFERIVRAMKRGHELPLIELYRLGDEYYVVDGHHRVAAALTVGQLAMDAHVVEFMPPEHAARQANAQAEQKRSVPRASAAADRVDQH